MKLQALRYLLFYSLFCFSGVLSAQGGNGIIKGTVNDSENGDPLIGASVLVKELSTGASVDFDGNFEISLKPGNYTLIVSYIGFTADTIKNVVVEAGNTKQLNIKLTSGSLLQEVVIQATQVKNSETAVLNMQRKSLNIQDGISSTEMKTLGISDAAESMSQVTGSAVEEGKYLVVRGLGDRYSLSLLDGIILPGLDPTRNSASLNLIPSSIIDNVIIRKTYTPELPGNFSGGVADITTKALPDQFFLNASLSLGFNTNASFNNEFAGEPSKGSLDWLGYDDGTRALPKEVVQYKQYIRSGTAQSTASAGRVSENERDREIINATSDAFSTPFVPVNKTPALNHGVSVDFGDRFNVGKKSLGIIAGLDYNRSFEHYTSGVFNTYSTNTDAEGNFAPNPARQFDLNQSTEKVELGAIAGVTYEFNADNRISLKNIYNHSGAFTSTKFQGFYPEAISSTTADFHSYATGFSDNMLNFTNLSGTHSFPKSNGIEINWSAAYNMNRRQDPDLRMFAYVEENGEYSIRRSETAGDPRRFFRDLQDNQLTGKVDVDIPVKLKNGNTVDIKTGGYASSKQRNFSELYYDVPLTNSNFTNPSYTTFGQTKGDFDKFFSQDNFGFVDTPESNGEGLYGFGNIYRDMSLPSNQYTGSENIYAGYLMASTNITQRLKMTLGARIEHTDLQTQNEGPAEITVQDPIDPNETVKVSSNGNIQVTDILPSVNLTYELSQKTNLRGAFSQTIARPNMREISPFRSLGTIGADIVIGNPQLERTLIQNYDLRLETYPRSGELYALSVYYKQFQNPIIVNIYSTGSAIEQQPNNVEEATVYGAEFEMRKSLDFISEKMAAFKFLFNASLIYSEVSKNERELSQIEDFSGAEGVTKETRPLQGQSPYIINAALMHTSKKYNWNNSLRFNIFGRRLAYQTPAQLPDVYEVPRPSLDFTSSKKLSEKFGLSFKVSNIFNVNYRQEFDFTVAGTDNRYRDFQLGRTFSMSLNYSF